MGQYSGKPGRRPKSEYALSDEQRVSLGRDRWFDLEELAAELNVTEDAMRAAVNNGAFPVYWVQGQRRRVMKAKGLDVVRWRDELAGLSDGRVEDFERVGD